MTPTPYALLIGTGAIAVALLSAFDIIPAQVAQYVPLAVVPFAILCRRNACAVRGC